MSLCDPCHQSARRADCRCLSHFASLLSVVVFMLATLVLAPRATAGDMNRIVAFDIEAQSLGKALLEFGAQAHLQIAFASTRSLDRRQSVVLRGKYTAKAALAELLKGTQFHFVQRGKTTEISPDNQASTAHGHSRGRQAEAGSAPTENATEPDPAGRASSGKRSSSYRGTSLQEVIVTGTHLLGVHATASPTSTYSRGDIYATGARDIYQFMQTVPSTLGDVNPVAQSANQYGRANLLDNASEAVGIDLRGLGPQSTLVLLNGQRAAPGNITGNFVDVSLIPLNAISHIDVVRDSASATYGADAVGGVVNIDTLMHFSGSESAVSYGSVTAGGRHESQFDETWGTSWNGGGAVLAYEFDDQTPLNARSRSFTENLPSPYTLFPEQVRHGLYGSFHESIGTGLRVSGFALYGHRTDRAEMIQAGIYYLGHTKVDSYIAALSARKTLSSGGMGTASVDYSGNDTDFNQMAQLGAGEPFAAWDNPHGRSALLSVHLGYSGWIGHLNGRRVAVAAGVQAQQDRFSYDNFWAPSPSYRKSRTVMAEYVEARVPVTSGIAFDASLRHENYSDFGSTTNPKFGLQWRPNSSVTFAGTYSTSFVAPTLSELVPNTAEAGYLPVPNPQSPTPCSPFSPSAPGCAVVLTTGGGNPSLGAEKANTWTGSVRFHPASAKGLRADLSVYEIHQRGVINTIFSYIPSIFQCLDFAPQLGSPVVTSIDAAQAEARFPNATNPLNVNETAVSALCDGRYLNLSRVSTSGLDLEIRYLRKWGRVSLKSTVSGTRILQYRTEFTAAAPQVSFLNTVNNPVALKVRAGETMSLSRLSASVFANYVGSYTNDIVTPSEPISSWTTVDLIGTYSASLGSHLPREVSITLGVDNVTNRSPPFVSNDSPVFPMDFDGANANPLGRYLFAEAKVRL